MPETYWRYGWPARLSLAAKYFYIISLIETEESPFAPWWSRSVRALSKCYGCFSDIGRGARELADNGIIEIMRAVPIKRRGIYFEEAQYYRNEPFYDPSRFERAVLKLEREYSRSAVSAARETAGLFFKSRDIETLRAVCMLIKEKGGPKVLSAAQKISRLPTSSSRRCLNHLFELVGG